MVSSTPRPHFTPGKDPIPILQEAGWAPGPVWTGGKSRPHRDSIPDRPARSQSLYRLSYPAHPRYSSTAHILISVVPETSWSHHGLIVAKSWFYHGALFIFCLQVLYIKVDSTYLPILCKSYLLTYLFHGAESFLRS